LPPILEYVTLVPNISKGMLTKDILILIFGIIGFITGTYSTILAIVKEFSG
jgi:proton-coupled amino acid transporter